MYDFYDHVDIKLVLNRWLVSQICLKCVDVSFCLV
jgi:hypothetical protein